MSRRERFIAAAVVAAIHLVAIGLLIGEPSSILDGVFQNQAEAILDGALPYADRGYEYPPLSLPLVLAPGLISDSELAYRQAFGWEMMFFDLAIVALLAFALRGETRRVWGALAVYTVGIVGLSGAGPLPDSVIELGAARARALRPGPRRVVLAAALAREAPARRPGRLAFDGGGGQGLPTAPLPQLPARRARFAPRRGRRGAAAPLRRGIVLVTGDEFGSAIDYHSGRGLQIESLGSNLFLIAHLFGAGASTTTEAGAFAIEADGAGSPAAPSSRSGWWCWPGRLDGVAAGDARRCGSRRRSLQRRWYSRRSSRRSSCSGCCPSRRPPSASRLPNVLLMRRAC